jgi:hypothetical protein
MKILLLENGSPALLWLRGALTGYTVVEYGYPFVPEGLAKMASGCDRIVFSAAAIPAGIDLPYYKEELRALRGVAVPAIGLGRAGGILLEAHGAKVKMTNSGVEVRSAPSGWVEHDGVWMDERGNCAVLMQEKERQERVLHDWLAGNVS